MAFWRFGSVAGNNGFVDAMQTTPGWSWYRRSQNPVMKASRLEARKTPGAGGKFSGWALEV